ncbi:MAG: hypothetical protein AAF183_13000 [Pseudomonadota bacterium]
MVGVREYRTALKDAPEDLQREVFGAIKQTVDGVHGRGKANLAAMTDEQSGTLRRLYRKTTSRRSLSGRVGYLSDAARFDVFYARFIHDGTIHMPARPFHGNAIEAEQELDQARMVKARDNLLAALGGRGARR